MTTTALASSISRLQHLAVGVTLALSGVAWAAPVTPGQPLAPIVTTDQHDRTLRTEPTTRTLLFAAAAGARLFPMSQLPSRLSELPKNRPILLICNTQNRSRATFDALRQRGYTNLQFVQGGMSEWARRRWPMVAPSKVSPPTPAAR